MDSTVYIEILSAGTSYVRNLEFNGDITSILLFFIVICSNVELRRKINIVLERRMILWKWKVPGT